MEPEQQNLNGKLAALESLLFIHGEPLGFDKIEKKLGLRAGGAEELSIELQERLLAEDRGLALIVGGGKVQLATKAQFREILESFVKEELTEELTPASLEALSVIAYLGPISRSRLDYLRGVNSTFILRSLLLRGLIQRFPDPEGPQSYLYEPSLELVKHLGLGRKEDLPDYEKFQSLLRSFEGAAEENISQSEPPAP